MTGRVESAIRGSVSPGELLVTPTGRTPPPWQAMEGVPDFLRGRDWEAIGSLYSTDSQPGSMDEYTKTYLKRLRPDGSLLYSSAQASWKSIVPGLRGSGYVQAGRRCWARRETQADGLLPTLDAACADGCPGPNPVDAGACCRDHVPVAIVKDTVTLWRPTGPEELALVQASGWREWPPRLSGQPIFYPVLNEEYAAKIARDWNVPRSGVGYVTRFRVVRSFLDHYEIHQVGGKTILEYWIPAEDLPALNASIIGPIEVTAEYHLPRQQRQKRMACGLSDPLLMWN